MGLESLAIIGTLVSAAVSAYGAYSSAQASSEAAEYNATVAEQQGAVAQQAAEAEAEDRRRRARYLLGTQLANTGASGLSAEGSPLMVMVDSAVQEDLEARRIRYKGYLEATGYGSRAALSRYQSDQYRTAGYIGAGTSLLRGASQAGGQYVSATRGR